MSSVSEIIINLLQNFNFRVDLDLKNIKEINELYAKSQNDNTDGGRESSAHRILLSRIDALYDLAVLLRDRDSRRNPVLQNSLSNLVATLEWSANLANYERYLILHSQRSEKEKSETLHNSQLVLLNLQLLRVLVNSVAEVNLNRVLVILLPHFVEAIRKLLLPSLSRFRKDLDGLEDLKYVKDIQLNESIYNPYQKYVHALISNLVIGDEPEPEKEEANTKVKTTICETSRQYNGLLEVLFAFILLALKESVNYNGHCKDFELLLDLLDLFETTMSLYTLSGASIKDMTNYEKSHKEINSDVQSLVTVLDAALYASQNFDKKEDHDEDDKVEYLFKVIEFANTLSEFLFAFSDLPDINPQIFIMERLFNLYVNSKIAESQIRKFQTEKSFNGNDLMDMIKQINRRVFSVIGNFSFNAELDSQKDYLVQLALQILRSQQSAYAASCAMLVLANSISGADDRDSVLDKEPHLIGKVLGNVVESNNDEITFFSEPLLGQSLFQLLKILTTPAKFTLDDDKAKTAFIEEFKQGYSGLEKLILKSFDSVFFIKINLLVILRFLNVFIKNFLRYQDGSLLIEWFARASKNLVSSIIYSVRPKSLTEEQNQVSQLVKIKELSTGNKLLAVEVLQNLVNSVVINDVELHDTHYLSVLIKTVLLDDNKKDDDNEEDYSVSLASAAPTSTPENKNDDAAKLLHLSQKYITLTILVSNVKNTYVISTLAQTDVIDSIFTIVRLSFDLVEQVDQKSGLSQSEEYSLKGLKNNLKVFVFKAYEFVTKREELVSFIPQFEEFIGKAANL